MKTTGKNYWIILLSILSIVSITLHYAIELDFFSDSRLNLPILRKLSMSLFLLFIILLVAQIINKFIEANSNTEGDRYNLLRISNFISIILISIVVVSFLFQNLYATAVSFGLISIVLGFALQDRKSVV